MTTPADQPDLIAWLRQQLDDDEEVAREALHPDAVNPGVWTIEHHNSEHHSEPNRCHIAEDRSGHYWSVAHEVFIPNAEHMARHDPARVLAEVDAKRRILDAALSERHQVVEDCWYTCPAATEAVEGETNCDDDAGTECRCGRDFRADRLARLLALPYADRPGYRSEWAP